MRFPNLINAGLITYSTMPRLTCTDPEWLAILRAGKWSIDITGEHAEFGPAIFNEIASFEFPLAKHVWIECVAAGCLLRNNIPGDPVIVLDADLSLPPELMRIEYYAGMMRVSGAEWPQWNPAPSTYAGEWVDVSTVWGDTSALLSLQIGATGVTLLSGTAPMWTVSDVLLIDGVLP